MNRQNLAFLLAGFTFGALIAGGFVYVSENQPALQSQAAQAPELRSPAGPMAPTQVGPAAGGAAPMMAVVRDLRLRVEENAKDLEALVRLANVYHEVSMWDQAIDYYERALEIRSEDPDLLTDMGLCFRGKGAFDRALQLFDRAHTANPAHWQSLFNSVVVAGFDLGQFDVAAVALGKLQELEQAPPKLQELHEALEQVRATAESGGSS